MSTVGIIITFVFVSNFILAQFLGLCPFIGVSRRMDSAVGMGFAVIFVMIMATGIVVRLISPLLESKQSDPAVVTMDDAGRFAISLTSGHLGGANRLAGESNLLYILLTETPVCCTGAAGLLIIILGVVLLLGGVGEPPSVQSQELEVSPDEPYDG